MRGVVGPRRSSHLEHLNRIAVPQPPSMGTALSVSVPARDRGMPVGNASWREQRLQEPGSEQPGRIGAESPRPELASHDLAKLLPTLVELPDGFAVHREAVITSDDVIADTGFEAGLRRDYVGRLGVRGAAYVLSARCLAFREAAGAVRNLDALRIRWTSRQRATMTDVGIERIGQRTSAAEGWLNNGDQVLAVAALWFQVDRFVFQFVWMGTIDVSIADVVSIARSVATRVAEPAGQPGLVDGSRVPLTVQRSTYRSAVPIGATCPIGFPVKGNQNSRGDLIYHVPGGRFYDCTIPSECFASAEEAEAVGYRASKR